MESETGLQKLEKSHRSKFVQSRHEKKEKKTGGFSWLQLETGLRLPILEANTAAGIKRRYGSRACYFESFEVAFFEAILRKVWHTAFMHRMFLYAVAL